MRQRQGCRLPLAVCPRYRPKGSSRRVRLPFAHGAGAAAGYYRAGKARARAAAAACACACTCRRLRLGATGLLAGRRLVPGPGAGGAIGRMRALA